MNTKLLCFVGGIATAVVAKMVASSPKTRELTVKGLATGMQTTDKLRATLASVKQDAEDLVAEARAKAAE